MYVSRWTDSSMTVDTSAPQQGQRKKCSMHGHIDPDTTARHACCRAAQCGGVLGELSSTERINCAWVIASRSASRWSSIRLNLGISLTKVSAASVSFRSVSARSACPCEPEGRPLPVRDCRLACRTYICGAIGLSFSSSGRRDRAMVPSLHRRLHCTKSSRSQSPTSFPVFFSPSRSLDSAGRADYLSPQPHGGTHEPGGYILR